MKALVFNQEKALVGAFSVITNLRMDLRFKLYHQVVRLHFEKMRISSRTPIKEPEDECGDSLVLYDADWADPQRILKVDTGHNNSVGSQ